jgi:Chaperone of endosialidase
MKSRLKLIAICHLLTVVCLSAPAQGTAFTFQGRLTEGGNPANGLYDFRSGPVATNIGGALVAGPVTNTAVMVSNGLFVLTLDYGAVFDGTPYWLQIGVRTNGGGTFIGLSPRPEVTPTPYAIFAITASNLSGTLPAAQLSGIIPSADMSGTYGNALNLNNAANTLTGTFSGNGASVTSLNANNLASGTVPDARLSANVALRAGGNALTGNQTITSGNVGIGTTAPKMALQVNGANGTAVRVVGPAGGGSTVAYDLSTYDPGTNPPAAKIQATDNGNYGNDLDLLTRIPGSATNALVSRLHISSATGNIGIGTTNPAAPLEVAGNIIADGTFTGNGGGLINLNAAQLTSIGNMNGGSGNFFVGPAGGAMTTGSYNTAIGENTLLFNSSGSYNTAIGYEALYSNGSGSENTANGYKALYSNTSGSENTAIGLGALSNNQGGGNNLAIGHSALTLLAGGSDNIAVGYTAGNAFTGNESGNIDIGSEGVRGENNIIRIGSGQTATYLAGTVYGNNVVLTSDRNAKENFTAINAGEVLAKVAALPVTKWNYRTAGQGEQHIGPMAQDFQAAFGLNGADDKHISVVDEGGVALAAIQGLNQKLQDELGSVRAENAKLRHVLMRSRKKSEIESKLTRSKSHE